MCPASKQQLSCKKTLNLLKIVYGSYYGDSQGIYEMSQIKGDRFAFSYRERNQREVSFKNLRIENGKVQTKFTY